MMVRLPSISLFPRRRARSPIGLDFGGSGVRAVQLARVGRGWVVERSAMVERHGEPTQEPGPVPGADELLECLSLGSFFGATAEATLGTPEVEFVSLELPEAVLAKGGPELDRAVGFEMQRLAAPGKDGVETRYWRLPPTKVPAPNALGVAADRPLVERLIGVCRHAGLRCEGVDAAANALCRFGLALRSWPDDSIWGLLDVGQRQSRLVVCADRTPLLVRSAGAGGRQWTQRIAEGLNVSSKAAEVLKRDYGLVSGAAPRSADHVPASGELGAVLRGILRGDLNELAAEIKRSYEYALSCYPARRAADLVLVGAGAALAGLGEFLSGLLGIPVFAASAYMARPDCRLGCPAAVSKHPEAFAAAIGAVLETDE